MPEGVADAYGRVRRAGGSGQSPGFVWPDEVPWSVLGPHVIEAWGHDEDGHVRYEHMEIEGQNGSGKSYFAATALQQRAAQWGSAEIACLSKQTDDSIPLLGWPAVGSYGELRGYRQAVFWPQTDAKGEAREKFHEARFYELLSALWPDPGEMAHVTLYLDEIRYLESLSPRLKKMIRMYWREGRSHGIGIVAGAQRPLEMGRDMHSEARWRAVFAPSDEADMERFAQLLGPHRDWEPVLRSLDQTLHQFVLRNSFTKVAFVTWVDEVLRPLPSQSAEAQRPAARDRLYVQRRPAT